MANKKTFYIEITTLCNLSCPFCPSTTTKRNKIMDQNKFQKIINEIKPYSQLVYFHLLGEPVLHPKFKEYVLYCIDQGLKVGLTTNGVKLSNIDDELLMNNSFEKINISLQCLIDFKEEDRVQYLINLHDFLKNKHCLSPLTPINLRLWNNKKNNDVNKMNENLINLITSWIENEKYINVRFSYDDEFEWPSLSNEKTIPSNCLGGKRQLGILNNGDVVLCCLDYLGQTKLGNIFDESLKDILDGKVYKDAINSFATNKLYFELCQKCSYRSRFS